MDADIMKHLVRKVSDKVYEHTFTPTQIEPKEVTYGTPVASITRMEFFPVVDITEVFLTEEDRRTYDFLLAKVFMEAQDKLWDEITNMYPASPALPLYDQNYHSAVLDRHGKIVKVID